MRLAVPDLVSNSYFPCAAAGALGMYANEGIDIEVVHISPVEACAKALADGDVDFIGASAHAPLAAFPHWNGAKLLCAQSQGMYWFLVLRSDLDAKRGDVTALAGRRIAAVPFVAAALRQLVRAAGLDEMRDRIEIVAPQSALRPGVNFGVAAAEALAEHRIDGFFANGMGAEIAVTRGAGKILLDIRRGDGPPECFHYTMPSVATTDSLLAKTPEAAAAVVRAVIATQNALKADVSLAAVAGEKLFPSAEAKLIAQVVARDLPFYVPTIAPEAATRINAYAASVGMQTSAGVRYEDIVAPGIAAHLPA